MCTLHCTVLVQPDVQFGDPLHDDIIILTQSLTPIKSCRIPLRVSQTPGANGSFRIEGLGQLKIQVVD